MPKREDIEGRGRPDENELAKRYGQIGIKAVAAAARSENNENTAIRQDRKATRQE